MEQFTKPSAPSVKHRRFLLCLEAGAWILGILVLLMAGLSLRESLRNHRQVALATAQNLAQVLDRHMADTLGKVDLLLLAVKDEVEHDDDLEAFLQRQDGRTPGLRSLCVADAQGRVRHCIGTTPSTILFVEDRDYFRRLRDDPSAGAVISPPLQGLVTKDWMIVMARRLEGPGRRFAGITFAVIPLNPFQRLFDSLDVGAHGAVALRSLDLGLVVRSTWLRESGTAMGETNVSDKFRAFVRSGRETGTFHVRTPFDGIRRTLVTRRVSGQPFYVLVAVADRDYLGGWRREVAQEVFELVLILGITLVGFRFIRRAWLRQQTIQADLERALAEVKTLGGLLPICSHCKKIRDDGGYWNQLEAYLSEHTEAEFTHGICPDCAREYFPRKGASPPGA